MSDLQKQIEERIKQLKIRKSKLAGEDLTNEYWGGALDSEADETRFLKSLNVSDYVKVKDGDLSNYVLIDDLDEYDKKKRVKSDYVKKEDLKPAHKCKKIATCDMAENRDWWLGELTETIKEYPQETHCLHLKTPAKDIVFLCNSGDFSNLAVFAEIALGYKINSDWMKSTIDRYLVK